MTDDLSARLRGQYAMGPHLPNGQPEFGFRQFEAPPIQHEAADTIEALRARVAELEGANADLKSSVVCFAGPWAADYASKLGLKRGELHPVHYDILERCGARMDDFTRAALTPQGER